MAVYSRYNPATGQFEYMQGAPAAPQYGGDPASWDYRYWGQADPRAYPDYWADPNGSLLAQAMQAGLGWTAPQAPSVPYVAPALPLVPPEVGYIEPQAPHYAGRLERSWLGDVANAVAGPNGYPARAARWVVDTGRRAAEAQDEAEDWIAGIR